MDHKRSRQTRNICIVTTQRSGSTWLMQLLNGTGSIRAYGEIFLEWARVADHDGDAKLLPPEFFADYVARNGSKNVSAYLDSIERSDERPVAFKIMYDQIRRNPQILALPILRGYEIIHLTRKNFFHIVMSRLLARETKVYHSLTKIDASALQADPTAVMDMIKRIDWQTRLAQGLFFALPFNKMEVCYEDVAADPGLQVNRILEGAGLSPVPLAKGRSNWTKTNTRSAAEVFANYVEIEALLSKSRFAWMLEDERSTVAAIQG